MFVRFHEHPNSSHWGVWSYKSSYKKVLTARGSDSANDNVETKVEYQNWEVLSNDVYGDAF